MVLEINPYSKAHGTKEKVWNDISDRLNVKGGTDGASCKAKVVALIKTYKLEKEEHLKTTGCIDNELNKYSKVNSHQFLKNYLLYKKLYLSQL